MRIKVLLNGRYTFFTCFLVKTYSYILNTNLFYSVFLFVYLCCCCSGRNKHSVFVRLNNNLIVCGGRREPRIHLYGTLSFLCNSLKFQMQESVNEPNFYSFNFFKCHCLVAWIYIRLCSTNRNLPCVMLAGLNSVISHVTEVGSFPSLRRSMVKSKSFMELIVHSSKKRHIS